jgi:hypothetical protein
MVKESPFADFYLKKYDNKYPITGKDWLDRQSLDEIIRIIEEELN